MDMHSVEPPLELPDDPEDALSSSAAGETVTAAPAVSREPLAPAATVRKSGARKALMRTAAVGLVLVAGAGVFAISPYGASFKQEVSTSPLLAPLLAPLTQLALLPAPKIATVKPPIASALPPSVALTEFLSDGGHPPKAAQVTLTPARAPAVQAPAQLQAVAGAVKPGGQTTHAPVAQTLPGAPTKVTQTTVVQTAVSAVPTTAPIVRPDTRPHVPSDPVMAIGELHAAPMSDTQQIAVLQLVTELGTIVRTQRQELAQLREDQKNLDIKVDSELKDFDRRMSLAEARGAVDAAMGVAAGTLAASPAPATPRPFAIQTAAAPAPTPVPASTPVDMSAHRYHIEAASPGLAMLSLLDASGGEEQQIPVSPGDQLPGYGQVLGIAQSGSTWIIRTEHGTIQ